MAKSRNLNSMYVRQCGIITLYDNLGQTMPNLLDLFRKFCFSYENVRHYYFIVHDDVDKLHIHFAFIFEKPVRISTMISKISEFCNIDVLQVSCEKLVSLNANLRYMLHLDESIDKKRYAIDDIYSDESITSLQDYIDSDNDELTTTRLIQICLTYSNEVDIMNHVGLTTFHKYRYEIRVLLDNASYLAYHYKHLIPEKIFNDKDLPF